MDIARSHYQSVPDYGSWYRLICNGEQTAQAKMVYYDVIKYYINSNIQNPKAPTTMLKIRPFVSFRKIFRHAAWKKHENESMNPYTSLNMLVFVLQKDGYFISATRKFDRNFSSSAATLQFRGGPGEECRGCAPTHPPQTPSPRLPGMICGFLI